MLISQQALQELFLQKIYWKFGNVVRKKQIFCQKGYFQTIKPPHFPQNNLIQPFLAC